MIQHYYLPYNEKLDINYKYILALYQIASYDKVKKRYCNISYDTKKNLSRQLQEKTGLKTTPANLSNILADSRYQELLRHNPEAKTIELVNDIKNCKKFVVLSAKEAALIIQQGDKLFAKYLLYLKFYCGKAKSKTIDTTAAQFLEACGYCKDSNSYKNKLTGYNSILCGEGLLSIEHYIDCNGRYRNIYRYT